MNPNSNPKSTQSKHIIVIGTDTGIGKTFVSKHMIATWKSLRPAYIKPFQTGKERDKNEIFQTGIKVEDIYEINHFTTPASPHLAMALDNINLEEARAMYHATLEEMSNIMHEYSYTITEGSGGLLVPLIVPLLNSTSATKDISQKTFLDFLTDLSNKVNYNSHKNNSDNSDRNNSKPISIVLVAPTGLGTLNHTLLTVKALQPHLTDTLKLSHIVLNDHFSSDNEKINKDNVKTLEILTGCSVSRFNTHTPLEFFTNLVT